LKKREHLEQKIPRWKDNISTDRKNVLNIYDDGGSEGEKE
jgi:hypothetical protein